jgi:hypothetical protein
MNKTLVSAIAGMLCVVVAPMTALSASKSSRIQISYELPKEAEHRSLYDQLKERRVLERLQEFLSPFRLPRTLKISLAGCDGEADAFYGEDAITICYEYVEELRKNMPEKTTPAGIDPFDTVVGPFIDTSLHEFAHALFDMLKLPILGREEDAADQVAAYIYLQFGEARVRRLIMGTAYAYFNEARRAPVPPSLKAFSDEHGTPAQRMFNVLCIAYGADQKGFSDFVTKGNLPKKRADACQDEYEQVQDAFQTLVLPHIDQDLADKVLDRKWLPKSTR